MKELVHSTAVLVFEELVIVGRRISMLFTETSSWSFKNASQIAIVQSNSSIADTTNQNEGIVAAIFCH